MRILRIFFGLGIVAFILLSHLEEELPMIHAIQLGGVNVIKSLSDAITQKQ